MSDIASGSGSMTPPLVRLVGPGGIAVYPEMKPDGKGDWEVANPEEICALLGYPPPANETKARKS